MNHPVLAAQLYTIRQHTQTAADFAASMAKIRAIGYTAVQVSGTGPIEPAEIKRAVDDNGLTICITHIGYDQLLNHTQAVIEQHKLWDCRNVAIGSMPDEFRGSAEGIRRFAEQANIIGARLAEAGLTFSYHNHSFEFVRYEGKTGLEILYAAADPRYLKAEIDTYWVQHGGGDPAAWIRRVQGRMPVVHLKDMAVEVVGGETRPVMAEVGEGNLNWGAILLACREAGVKWYAVEQDICQRDPFESLAISYQNLNKLGLR